VVFLQICPSLANVDKPPGAGSADVLFLYGKLHRILRSQTPLEILSLKSSPLKLSDLKHLFQCPSNSQLKYLHLQDCSLKELSPPGGPNSEDKRTGPLTGCPGWN
jgi:hypothetical protein